MRALTTCDLLRAWERGDAQHPVDQALTLLAMACPEKSWEELASLSIAERDVMLLTTRERTLGERLEGYVECSACGERLEFSLDSREVCATAAEAGPAEDSIEVDGVKLRFRLPNSLDLAAAAVCPDVTSARDVLVRRCVLEARRGEAEVASTDLEAPVSQALASQMVTSQPLSEVLLELDCSRCGARQALLLDIASFFWTEVAAEARRLAWEVHTLAQAYGWREADILALSARRRALYLEMTSR